MIPPNFCSPAEHEELGDPVPGPELESMQEGADRSSSKIGVAANLWSDGLKD